MTTYYEYGTVPANELVLHSTVRRPTTRCSDESDDEEDDQS